MHKPPSPNPGPRYPYGQQEHGGWQQNQPQQGANTFDQRGQVPEMDPASSQHSGKKRGIVYVVTGVVVAVALAGLVVFLVNDKSGGTASRVNPFASAHKLFSPPSSGSEPSGSTAASQGAGGSEANPFIQVGYGLERALTSKNVDQIMGYVCEDGKTHGAQGELMTIAPYLDPANSDHTTPISFLMINIKKSPQDSTNGKPTARIQINGTYKDGRSTTIEFLLVIDNRTNKATWCGIARVQ